MPSISNQRDWNGNSAGEGVNSTRILPSPAVGSGPVVVAALVMARPAYALAGSDRGSFALAHRPVDHAPGVSPLVPRAAWMARIGSPRRAPEPKNANDSSVPNTMWANSSNGWLASWKVVKASGARIRKFSTYSSAPYSVPASATVPLVRNLGTASANSIPNSADSTRCTATPTPMLVLPAAMALSPLTMVEIMCSGMLALPPVESANHMVTAANTMPARIPPTAPRSSLAGRVSSRLPLSTTVIADHLPALNAPGRDAGRPGAIRTADSL